MKQILLILQILLATSASADWLQTQDGAKIETEGPWKVRGSMVVFTSPGGTLSSIRLSEVDLDASAIATVEAKAVESAPPPPPVKGKAVLVLTDKDVARASPSPALPGSEDPGDPEAQAAAPADQARAEPVTVTRWREVKPAEADGIEIRGTLQNHAKQLVTDVRVLVRLRDREGELLGVSNAFLNAASMAPGTTMTFRAIFPDVAASTVQAEFEIQSHQIEIQTASPQQEEGNES